MTRNAKRETRYRPDVSERPGSARLQRRRFSKEVFGNSYMLEVAAAIGAAEGGVFYSRQLADVVGVADNVVHPVVRRLEAAGLVTKLPSVEAELRQYLRREESALWAAAIALLSEAEFAGTD